jgi:hypothetical protein
MDARIQELKRRYVLSGSPMDAVRFANAVLRSSGDAPPPRQGVYMTIPTIGTELELAADWNFNLYNEGRNRKFWEKIIPEVAYYDAERDRQMIHGRLWGYSGSGNYGHPVTLPQGTRLKVARIYIRQGADSFDSITFTIVKHSENKKIKGRFWVKLAEVNQMFVNWEASTLKGVEV